MSRGLGTLQREILAALDQDHEAHFRTYDTYSPVYNLHAVKATLAQRGQGRTGRLFVPELSAVYVWHTAAFTSAFSRAIHTLMKRGLLRHELHETPRGTIDDFHTHYVSRAVEASPDEKARMFADARHAEHRAQLAYWSARMEDRAKC
jgi:hypothetical protein